MRQLLNPGLRRLWRDLRTVQLGVDPRRALVLTGLDEDVAGVLDLLDGTRDRAGVVEAAAATGVEGERTGLLLDLLATGGALVPGPAAAGLSNCPRGDRDRLGPDISSWSLVDPQQATDDVLLRRQQARVLVLGAGRVGVPLAATLAAAGVGRVAVSDGEPAALADCAVGGLCAADVGAARELGARAAVRQAAPRVDNRPWLPGETLDLVIIAPTAAPVAAAADDLIRSGVVHLVARVRELTGVVGPLVIPGQSSCMRCQDLYRTDRDPRWPVLAAQLSAPRRTPDPCDAALACAVAGQSALQALDFLDRPTPARGLEPSARPLACRDATLELTLPDYRWRRRSWPSHPGCGCSWPDAS